MDEQTTQAASSTATIEAPQTFEAPRSGSPEYAEWRKTGTMPEKKVEQVPTQTASSAGDPGKDQSDDAADSAAILTQEQERSNPKTESRWKKLTDELKQLRTDLEEARRPKQTQAEPSPAKPAPPQTYQDWRKSFSAAKWVEQYGKDNPEAGYEDATAAMADFLGDVRDQFRSIEQQRESQAKELNTKVADARARYGETFDDVVWPTLTTIVSDAQINPNVKAMFNDSDVVADLLFTIGSDSKTMNEFIQMAKTNPGKALRYIAIVENGIVEQLSGSKPTPARNTQGQFTAPEPEKPAPVKRGPESAPEPPIELNARGGPSIDEGERALKDAERGDSRAFARWKQQEDAKELRRRRGA